MEKSKNIEKPGENHKKYLKNLKNVEKLRENRQKYRKNVKNFERRAKTAKNMKIKRQ